MNRRPIYLLFVGLFLLLGLAGMLYYFSKKANKTSTNSGTLSIKKVLDERVISPVAGIDNPTIWYFNTAGRLFKANTDGSNLSEFPLPALANNNLITQALWPKTGKDFILFFGTGPSTVKYYYDSAHDIFAALAPNIQWLEWMPDGKRVLYIWQSTDKKTQQLVLANPDGSGFRSIASVFWPDLAIKSASSGKYALMYRTNIQGDTNKIYGVNLESSEISTWVNQGKNFNAVWLPIGDRFLFTQGTGIGDSKVFLYDLAKKEITDLKLSTTLEKTVVDSAGKTLYAAVPNKNNSGDTFVKIDLASGKSESYYDPGSATHVKSLMLVGNTIYFIADPDGKLYMIGT